MLSLAIMSIVVIISIFQVFHHMGYLDDPLQGISHVLTNEFWEPKTPLSRAHRWLRSDQPEALLPCWEIERPCWPDDEPQLQTDNGSETQAVVRADGTWYTPLIYVFYAWKSAASALPVLMVMGVIPIVVYVVYSGIAASLCPGVTDMHLSDLQAFLLSSRREIENRASQTSKELLSDMYRSLELQESRSLEVIMDILNEMNDGLTMQQWYEQQKLNHMMEDDLRAAQLTCRHRSRAGEVARGLHDLRRVTDKRQERLAALQESQQRARSAFARCMDLLGQLREARVSCAESSDKETYPQPSTITTQNHKFVSS